MSDCDPDLMDGVCHAQAHLRGEHRDSCPGLSMCEIGEKELRDQLDRALNWIERAMIERDHEYDGCPDDVPALPQKLLREGEEILRSANESRSSAKPSTHTTSEATATSDRSRVPRGPAALATAEDASTQSHGLLREGEATLKSHSARDRAGAESEQRSQGSERGIPIASEAQSREGALPVSKRADTSKLPLGDPDRTCPECGKVNPSGVHLLDDNPVSIATYLIDHPQTAKLIDEALDARPVAERVLPVEISQTAALSNTCAFVYPNGVPCFAPAYAHSTMNHPFKAKKTRISDKIRPNRDLY